MPSNNTEIGSGLTDQQLQAASWWVKNGATLKRVGYGTLIGLSAIFWGYSLWSLLDAYAISYPREQRITATIANNHLVQASLDATAPQALSASAIQGFSGTDNRRDFAVQLSNSNTQWWAEFDYVFNFGGASSTKHTGFILPNSQNYLTELGYAGAGEPQLNLQEVRWHRIVPSDVGGDYAAFRDKRLRLTVDNVAYQKDVQVEGHTIGRSTFNLVNSSAYGFWSVDLTLILYRADGPVALNTLNVKNLKPGEVRPLTVDWFENLTNISRTDIVPSVNILDAGAYLPTQQF